MQYRKEEGEKGKRKCTLRNLVLFKLAAKAFEALRQTVMSRETQYFLRRSIVGHIPATNGKRGERLQEVYMITTLMFERLLSNFFGATNFRRSSHGRSVPGQADPSP